jgi:hypothetical protein
MRYPNISSVTTPTPIASVMGTSAQFLAAIRVGDAQAEEANGDGDEDEISHALVSRGFDVKPQAS